MASMPLLRLFTAGLVWVLVAAGAFTRPAVADDRLSIVNLMPAFWEAWDHGRSVDERVRLFEQLVAVPNHQAYGTGQFALDEVHIAWYLQDVVPYVPRMRELTAMLSTEIPTAERRFLETFPDLRSGVQVYFMPSMLHFDGQTNNGVLRFGIDGIARFDGANADLGVLVSHELFHIYHAQVSPDVFGETGSGGAPPIWRQLWSEGLATYVSSRLNPDASKSQVLLSTALGTLPPADVQRLACAIAPALDAADGSRVAPFFDAGMHPPQLPSRGGYLVGFLVARDLDVAHDLRALAVLRGEGLRTAIGTDVARICRNGPDPA
ncbi:MAG TPA: hypothetical protein VMA36_00420 [Candidatus Limnocylindria bacterium]|nr:hypothetical protein [Candidatus Limnocylindria bacterium]